MDMTPASGISLWSFFSSHYDDAVVVNVAAAAGVAAFKGGMVVFIVRNGAVLCDIDVTLTLQWRSLASWQET